jgi:ACT domain-containing protein
MEKELVFITVIGVDRKGIVAAVSTFLYEKNINIVDINQRIMTDGYFVMTMLADIINASVSMDELCTGLEKTGDDLNMIIRVQHENIFKMMHRI